MLENALVQRETDQDDRDRERQRNVSAADAWFRSKRSKKRSRDEGTLGEGSSAGATPPMTMEMMLRAQEEEEEAAAAAAVPVNGTAPEIPIWLAEARGCDPLPPDTPPQDCGAQQHAWMASSLGCSSSSSQSGVGLGLSSGSSSSNNAYLLDEPWAMLQPLQPDYYSISTGHSHNHNHNPYVHQNHLYSGAGATALMYERARGSATAATPPTMHDGPDKRRYYDRPVGSHHLPYPHHHHLNEFLGPG